MSNFVFIILYYLFKGPPKLYELHAAQNLFPVQLDLVFTFL